MYSSFGYLFPCNLLLEREDNWWNTNFVNAFMAYNTNLLLLYFDTLWLWWEKRSPKKTKTQRKLRCRVSQFHKMQLHYCGRIWFRTIHQIDHWDCQNRDLLVCPIQVGAWMGNSCKTSILLHQNFCLLLCGYLSDHDLTFTSCCLGFHNLLCEFLRNDAQNFLRCWRI